MRQPLVVTFSEGFLLDFLKISFRRKRQAGRAGGRGQDNFNPQVVRQGHWGAATSRDGVLFIKSDSSVLLTATAEPPLL